MNETDTVDKFWNTDLKDLGCITSVDNHIIMLDDRVPSSEHLDGKMFIHNSVSTDGTNTNLIRRFTSCLNKINKTTW